MSWNLRLGAVYGPDRRPCPLWPLVELFPEDVDRKIADLLAPQPRLPTPQYYSQIKHHFSRSCQWQDAVDRFIYSYWDSPHHPLPAWYRLRYPRTPWISPVFVDWDDKGRATIDLLQALDSDEDDSDDSDDEHMSDDSDDSDDDSSSDVGPP